MATCKFCGHEIEWAMIDGRPTPIHVEGNWCDFSSSSSSNSGGWSLFQTIESYVNPNAICPCCKGEVFFYQSPHGGRVFFDALGWPWPKHPCTDNPKANIERVSSRGRIPIGFRDRYGRRSDLYRIVKIEENGNIFKITVKKESSNRVGRWIWDATEFTEKFRLAVKKAPALIRVSPDGFNEFEVNFINAYDLEVSKISCSIRSSR